MDKRATDAIEIYSRTRCRRQEDGIVFVLCTFFPFLSLCLPLLSFSLASPVRLQPGSRAVVVAVDPRSSM